MGHVAPTEMSIEENRYAVKPLQQMGCTGLTQFWVIFDPGR